MRINQLRLPLEGALGATISARVSHNHVPVAESTFLAGTTAQVHRWFRLTPSFGPDLVRQMLSSMNTPADAVVLDPFAGAGTTLIECKLDGLPSYGFEINPFLHFVCSTSVNWNLNADLIRETLRRVRATLGDQRSRLRGRALEEIGIPLPSLHNVFRWWRRDVLAELLILREAIRSQAEAQGIRSFLELCLAAVLIPDLTNVTLGRLQLHFIDRSSDQIDVWATFERHARVMVKDLEEVPSKCHKVPAKIWQLDSTKGPLPLLNRRVDRVVTSPPYPNRYSYVWNTRPHLYLLGFLTSAREAADLDKRTIGGTWGTATSALAKGIVRPAYPIIKAVVAPVAERIRQADNLMANYLMHYFNFLAKQIEVQHSSLATGARCAYVVGCSRLKGVYVETDVLLGEVFEGLGLGYRVDRIERVRRRHSGKDLHESIVYVSRKA